jgi:multicomponent Na+:H+ antiporter subunit G
MTGEILQFAAGGLVLVAALFSAIAALGVVRFPDLYTRLHAVSKVGTLGVALVFLAIAVGSADPWTALRCLVGTAFILLASPLVAHLLARAASKSGIAPIGAASNNPDHH